METLIETAIIKKEEIGMFDSALRIMWIEVADLEEAEKVDRITNIIFESI